MSFARLIQLMLSTSVMMIVFSLGLRATMRDATDLFRQPRRLLQSALAMLIIMPIFAAVLAQALALPPAVKIVLIVLSVSPVPPILPSKELGAGGTRSYALGLLVAAAIVSIVFVPAAVELFGRIAHKPVAISAGTIARIVTSSVIVPLAAGLVVHRFWAGLARRVAVPLSRLAGLLLIIAVLPVLYTQIPAVISLLGHGTLLALTAFVVMGLVAGALLGGPEPSHRIVLALSTASRHPGVAMAIAKANFPDEKLVLPAILMYLIVSAIVSGVFLGGIRRRDSAGGIERRQSPAA
jgi:bile acid:Na+ symporter, BASS family